MWFQASGERCMAAPARDLSRLGSAPWCLARCPAARQPPHTHPTPRRRSGDAPSLLAYGGASLSDTHTSRALDLSSRLRTRAPPASSPLHTLPASSLCTRALRTPDVSPGGFPARPSRSQSRLLPRSEMASRGGSGRPSAEEVRSTATWGGGTVWSEWYIVSKRSRNDCLGMVVCVCD